MKISQRKSQKYNVLYRKRRKPKKKIENRELTDESFGVRKLEGDDSGETPTIKHRWNRMMSHLPWERCRERLGFQRERLRVVRVAIFVITKYWHGQFCQQDIFLRITRVFQVGPTISRCRLIQYQTTSLKKPLSLSVDWAHRNGLLDRSLF